MALHLRTKYEQRRLCSDEKSREGEGAAGVVKAKMGGDIVRIDTSNKGKTTKQKYEDYNPIIKVPIKGV